MQKAIVFFSCPCSAGTMFDNMQSPQTDLNMLKGVI